MLTKMLLRNTERGSSGSWVIDDGPKFLCGSIMACYENEPMAFMITAQTLLRNIEMGVGQEASVSR